MHCPHDDGGGRITTEAIRCILHFTGDEDLPACLRKIVEGNALEDIVKEIKSKVQAQGQRGVPLGA
jgi:hypothetical protein